MPCTPAASARAYAASRSRSNSAASKWQWLSIMVRARVTRMKQSPPIVRVYVDGKQLGSRLGSGAYGYWSGRDRHTGAQAADERPCGTADGGREIRAYAIAAQDGRSARRYEHSRLPVQ